MAEEVSSTAADARLKSFIERIERLDEDAACVAADRADVLKEAKAEGYSAKLILKVVGERRQDPVARQEDAALLDLYRRAGGL